MSKGGARTRKISILGPAPRGKGMAITVRGINYEGGKIIEHAEQCPQCVCAVNAQIAMDAPFHGAVADESVRSQGRSELQMSGFSEASMMDGLRTCFTFVVERCVERGATILMIQIARGRSASETERALSHLWQEQTRLHSLRVHVVHGYRSSSYFEPPADPFGFINVGMFARLGEDALQVEPGQVCLPRRTWDLFVPERHDEVAPLRVLRSRSHTVAEAILAGGKVFQCDLIGIDDQSPFVTPEKFKHEELLDVFGCGE